MSEEQDAVAIVEQELHEQERGLAEMEGELFGQERDLIGGEAQFHQKSRALLGFASYVREEEDALLRRLDAIGADAGTRARAILSASDSPTLENFEQPGSSEDRMVLLEKRRDLYAMRLEMLEAREVLLEQRAAVLDGFAGAVAEIESALLARQRLLGEVAREIFMGGGASSASDAAAQPIDRAPAPIVKPAASEKPRGRLNPVKVTLEARLDGDEGASHFEDDASNGALPTLFMPTPNLLKVGREVRVRVLRGSETVEVRGMVGWVRERGHVDGPPGMGLELLEVGAKERAKLTAWRGA